MVSARSVRHGGIVLVAASLMACAGAATTAQPGTPRRSPVEPDASSCTWEGSWTSGAVRAPGAGFVVALVAEADVELALESPKRVRVTARRRGWMLCGIANPGRDRTLRVLAPMWLGEALVLAPGRAVSVRSLQPNGVLEVGLSENGPASSDGIRWELPPSTFVACDQLGLRSPQPGWASTGAVRATAAVDAIALVRATLGGSAPIALAAAPGDAPLAFLEPGRSVAVAEVRSSYARIVRDVRGHLVVGWVAASVLSDTDAAGQRGGVGGAQAGEQPASQRVCTTSSPLELNASQESSPLERVGELEAGARFVPLATEAGGRLRIAPHPEDGVSLSPGVVLVIQRSAAVSCRGED